MKITYIAFTRKNKNKESFHKAINTIKDSICFVPFKM